MRSPIHLLKTLRTTAWLTVLWLCVGGSARADLASGWAKGPVASAQWQLMQTTVGLMLLVLIPVLVLVAWIPWHYRAGNHKARYAPQWGDSRRVDAVVWLVPSAIVIGLGALAWSSTHRLDPFKPLVSSQPALQVQAVALDWAWLFIYPDQRLATVNRLVVPSGRPIAIDLTSATVMNSFFIPRLGSQIYAMPGMTTRLHLQADQVGRYIGRNVQYSGQGFSDQHFSVQVLSVQHFNDWMTANKATGKSFSAGQLGKLLKPAANRPEQIFRDVPTDLFARLRNRFAAAAQR